MWDGGNTCNRVASYRANHMPQTWQWQSRKFPLLLSLRPFFSTCPKAHLSPVGL